MGFSLLPIRIASAGMAARRVAFCNRAAAAAAGVSSSERVPTVPMPRLCTNARRFSMNISVMCGPAHRAAGSPVARSTATFIKRRSTGAGPGRSPRARDSAGLRVISGASPPRGCRARRQTNLFSRAAAIQECGRPGRVLARRWGEQTGRVVHGPLSVRAGRKDHAHPCGWPRPARTKTWRFVRRTECGRSRKPRRSRKTWRYSSVCAFRLQPEGCMRRRKCQLYSQNL